MPTINTAVVNINLVRDSGTLCTKVNFTNTGANELETLTFIPTKNGNKLVVIITEGSGTDGSLSITVAAGNYWAAQAMGAVAVAQGTSKAFCFTPARYMTTTGVDATESKIVVTITPASGKKVWTDHDAFYQHFQLPL